MLKTTPIVLRNSGLVVTACLRRLPGQRKAIATPPIRRPNSEGSSQWINNGSLSMGGSIRKREGIIDEVGEGAGNELETFLELVPIRMRKDLASHAEIKDLVEIVMDLGRDPVARFPSGDWVISSDPVGPEDLKHAISKVGDFAEDNRSGINRSLHRISAIRNRKMEIIGLTCRVGRAISGSAQMIRDLIISGNSILVIGPPGVGKTTLIREIARILADEQKKRVIIVDTSNEIGGDGDVPHSGIGRARRMQVPKVSMQHDVMIEAVENHMPEVIVIDEIGTDLEALAASTIAQRGVQLVGTAHGVTIESLTKNPSLQLLVGGIESVTLSDEVAKKRKIQKTILERKGPPAFSCAVELTSKTECRVHLKLDATVDSILLGKPPRFELRKAYGEEEEQEQELEKEEEEEEEEEEREEEEKTKQEIFQFQEDEEEEEEEDEIFSHIKNTLRTKRLPIREEYDDSEVSWLTSKLPNKKSSKRARSTARLNVFTYEIMEGDLLRLAKVMGYEDQFDVTGDISTANAILVSRSEMKQNSWIRKVARLHSIPVYVVKSNTMAQLVKAIKMIVGKDNKNANKKVISEEDIEIQDDAPKRTPSLEEIDALEEARLAIEYIVIPGGEPVELLPRCSEIIARQLELVESYQLSAETSGTESESRLQILPIRINKKNVNKNGSGLSKGTSVTRLPLLPEM